MIFTLKWLFPYWRRHKWRMLAIVFFGILSAALQTASPLLIKNIINGLNSDIGPGYIENNVLLILGAGFLIYAVNLVAQRNRAYMNIRLEWEFRLAAFEHILYLDRNFYHSYTSGDLVTRLMDDISNKISWFSCSGVFRFIQSFFTLIAVISAMLYLSPRLTFWVLLPVPFILLFSIKTGRALTARYTSLQESITGLYDFLETCFAGIRVIKANAKEASQEKFFSQRTAAQKAAEIATARLGIVFSYFFHYAGFISVVILYAVGGKMVIEGKTGLGELIAFQFYSSMIIHPLMDISQFFIAGNRAGVSIKRVDELLKSKSGVRPPREPLQTGLFEKIAYSGVSLKTPKTAEFILKDLTFAVSKGRRAAVVGRIGSGKSTLLSLTLRLCDYSSGEIRLNGTDIRKLDLKMLRDKIGYVSQEPAIFTGNINDNILMGRRRISPEMTERALEISRLKQDLPRFPKGLETQVGTRGFALSGGQKQRLAIARAVLAAPELLLLDDATSAMDAGTEDEFWKMLKLHLPEAICIAVTHRSRTIETSDLILAMQEGRIAEQGTHHELIATAGLYKKIYERRKLEEAYKRI